MATHYHAHGKLLLTGEYFVLDGALALALTTRYGQRFRVAEQEGASATGGLDWHIHYPGDHATRHVHLDLPVPGEGLQNPGGDRVRAGLIDLITTAERLRPESSKRLYGQRVDCWLEFDPAWGLGSSSTLVFFLARLLEVNPYALLAGWVGGSGYDIACAGAEGPLLYERRADDDPVVTPIDWSPDWLAQTYFVHLNRKQNSREGIEAYRKASPQRSTLTAVSSFTHQLTDPGLHLRAAAQILESHEALVSSTLGIPRIRDTFPDFPGTLKSLGAWGGDFIWALSEEAPEKVRAYFNERGYATFIPYHDMAL
jgi:mevalonate kinase